MQQAKRQENLSVMLYYAKILKMKAMKALAHALVIKAISLEVQRKRNRRIARNVLTSWEKRLEVKLLQGDAISVCRVIFLRQVFKKWRDSIIEGANEERASLLRNVQLRTRAFNSLR